MENPESLIDDGSEHIDVLRTFRPPPFSPWKDRKAPPIAGRDNRPLLKEKMGEETLSKKYLEDMRSTS